MYTLSNIFSYQCEQFILLLYTVFHSFSSHTRAMHTHIFHSHRMRSSKIVKLIYFCSLCKYDIHFSLFTFHFVNFCLMSQPIVDCAQFSYNFIASVYFFFIPLPLSMVLLLLLLPLLSPCILFPMARNFSVPIHSRALTYITMCTDLSHFLSRVQSPFFVWLAGSVIFFLFRSISFNIIYII